MGALLIAMIALLLVETGGRNALLAAVLTARFGERTALFAGLAAASLLNAVLAVLAGAAIGRTLTPAPLLLFQSLALLFAGVGMLLPRRRVATLEGWRTGPFVTGFLGLFAQQVGDKGQFLILAIAAGAGDWPFALAGGWIGTMAALMTGALQRELLAQRLPLNRIRRSIALVLIMGAGVMAVRALGLG